jgi:hypothetical protein
MEIAHGATIQVDRDANTGTSRGATMAIGRSAVTRTGRGAITTSDPALDVTMIGPLLTAIDSTQAIDRSQAIDRTQAMDRTQTLDPVNGRGRTDLDEVRHLSVRVVIGSHAVAGLSAAHTLRGPSRSVDHVRHDNATLWPSKPVSSWAKTKSSSPGVGQ